MTHTEPRAKAITSAIGKMIVLYYQPYSVVEDRGFKELLNVLEPRYEIPSRTVFSRRVIPEMYDKCKARLKLEMDRELGFVQSISLTTDMWTSRSEESYISLTCHFMTQDFQMKRYAFANSYFPGQHTAVAVHQKLNSILGDWNLQQCSVPIYIVTENARNLTAAVAKTNWNSVPCLAHTMQLAITDTKKETVGFSELCQKGRSIVGHYRHSVTARERLIHLQKTMGKPEHNLIQDVEARWNSEHQILARLLEQRGPLSAELAENNSKIECFTQAEWQLVGEMVYILQPIAQATTELCAETYPTLSMVIPIISSIQTLLENRIKTAKGSELAFAKNLLKFFKSRFPDYKSIKPYGLAMMMDPRFKSVLMSVEEINLVTSIILKEICSTQESSQDDQPKDTVEESEPSNLLWGTFDKMAKQSKPEDQTQCLKEQINMYLSNPVIARHEDPCVWWKENGKQYSCLEKFAMHYLLIPATQAVSERLFSCAGNTVTVRRGSIKPEHLEQLVFLHHNHMLL